MYSPSSRAADIARLLDPSYSNNSPFTKHVYVDHHGDLHDPDYRDFPPVAHSHTTRTTRPRWETADVSVDDDDDDEPSPSYSYSPRGSARRFPHPTYSLTHSPTYSSWESDATCFSASDPFGEDEKSSVPRRAHRRTACPPKPAEPLDEDEDADADQERDPVPLPLFPDCAPSCSQALRRRWHALALRFRFGVFRAQRKVRRRLSNR
jgi:hypothetical protein